MPDPKVDFKFITEDVTRQRELAQEALAEAKRLDEEIQTEEDEPRKRRLEEAKKKWLSVALSLANNAAATLDCRVFNNHYHLKLGYTINCLTTLAAFRQLLGVLNNEKKPLQQIPRTRYA
jgi:hypothetical protein